jgi:hypothetical protein
MEENLHCYTFEKFSCDKKGNLDEVVDATYILHLKGNGRYEDILKQLSFYKPTTTIYIVFNEGFKNCKKSDFIKLPCDDLIDANYQILKHANKMGYDNVLILEDDFIFSSKIKDPFHVNNVVQFLKHNHETPMCYLLGCAPIMMMPYNYYHYKPLLSGGAHAVIYNMKMREIILAREQRTIPDWDYLGIWARYKYTYYTPLCYQLFPETENSKSWGQNESAAMHYITQLGPSILRLLNMDKSAEPGYSRLYIFSKILFLFVILFVILFTGFLLVKLFPNQSFFKKGMFSKYKISKKGFSKK